MEQKTSRRQKSRAEMEEKIALWHQSGQNKKDFCELSGLRVHVFDYWRKKCEGRGIGASPLAGFCEVAPDDGGLTSVVRVLYPNGLVVEFSEPPNLAYLQSLLRW